MYTNIIVALSLEHGIGDHALAAAQALLSDGGKITAVHVHEPPNRMILAYLDEEVVTKSNLKAKAKLTERVKDHSGISTVVLDGQSAGRMLTEYAGQISADCIIIASHQPGMKDFFLGSTAALVVRHSPCSVHVLRL